MLLLSGCSNADHEIDLNNITTTLKSNSSSVEANALTTQENQIYQYMRDIWPKYDEKYKNIDVAEAHVYIDTSMEFKISLIEINRAFSRIDNAKMKINLTDNEIDALAIKRFKQIKFEEKNGTWFYEGKSVNMGIPLPTPDSMKPKDPETNKELIVELNIEATVTELKSVKVKGTTNLPDKMDLMISLRSAENKYSGTSKVQVMNGKFETGEFTDAEMSGRRLANGTYNVVVTSPTVNVLDSSVKPILGDMGRNMKGQLVKFDEVFGNMISLSQQVIVQ